MCVLMLRWMPGLVLWSGVVPWRCGLMLWSDAVGVAVVLRIRLSAWCGLFLFAEEDFVPTGDCGAA